MNLYQQPPHNWLTATTRLCLSTLDPEHYSALGKLAVQEVCSHATPFKSERHHNHMLGLSAPAEVPENLWVHPEASVDFTMTRNLGRVVMVSCPCCNTSSYLPASKVLSVYKDMKNALGFGGEYDEKNPEMREIARCMAALDIHANFHGET